MHGRQYVSKCIPPRGTTPPRDRQWGSKVNVTGGGAERRWILIGNFNKTHIFKGVLPWTSFLKWKLTWKSNTESTESRSRLLGPYLFMVFTVWKPLKHRTCGGCRERWQHSGHREQNAQSWIKGCGWISWTTEEFRQSNLGHRGPLWNLKVDSDMLKINT